MGKRSNFDRIPRDFYPTPREAVSPLLPHIPKGARFIEPCAGAGDLVDHLVASGLDCVLALDIEPRRSDICKADTRQIGLFCPARWAEYIITNPPWDRQVLHSMIDHFSRQHPTWLLFDADWMHTRQAAPFMPWLRKVVSVGRVRWIPDSKMTGKDNCAWYLFDQKEGGATQFYGRSA